eukprot:3105479-Pyramimonas_sp.AAC.1
MGAHVIRARAQHRPREHRGPQTETRRGWQPPQQPAPAAARVTSCTSEKIPMKKTNSGYHLCWLQGQARP